MCARACVRVCVCVCVWVWTEKEEGVWSTTVRAASSQQLQRSLLNIKLLRKPSKDTKEAKKKHFSFFIQKKKKKNYNQKKKKTKGGGEQKKQWDMFQPYFDVLSNKQS